MPFPPNFIFTEFLNLYYDVRIEERESTWGLFVSSVDKAKSMVTRTDPTNIQIDQYLTKIKTAIDNAKDFNDWFKLIFTAREYAENTQNLKTKKSELSLSCAILHGLASLIILKMQSDPTYGPLLAAEVNQRIDKIMAIKSEKEKARKNKDGAGIQDYNAQIKVLVIQLAKLSQMTYVEKATKNNLFDYLPSRTEYEVITYVRSKTNQSNKIVNITDTPVNYAGSIELQAPYCQWLYNQEFQTSKKHISFADFLSTSVEKHLARLRDEQQDHAEAVVLAAAFATADMADQPKIAEPISLAASAAAPAPTATPSTSRAVLSSSASGSSILKTSGESDVAPRSPLQAHSMMKSPPAQAKQPPAPPSQPAQGKRHGKQG